MKDFFFVARFKLIVLLIFILFLFLRIPILAKDLAVEEGLFLKTGLAYIEKGKPEIYFDEIRPAIMNFDKPPLSRMLISLGYKLSGDNVWGARFVPFTFACLQFLFILFLTQYLYKGKDKNIVSYVSLFIYSVLPLAIHGAGEIQIDMIVSIFLAVYLFSAFSLIQKEENFLNNKWILFFSIFVAFATKHEPTLMALFAVNIFMILRRVGLKKLFFINVISLAGILLYLGIFYLYTSAVLNNSSYFLQPIQVIEGVFRGFFVKKFETADIDLMSNFGSNLRLLMAFINFVSIYIVLLLTGSLTYRDLKNPLNLFNLLIVFVVTVVYLVIGWFGLGFPRYFIPMIPSLIFLISLNSSSVIEWIKNYKIQALLTTIVTLFLYLLTSDKVVQFLQFHNIVKIIGIIFLSGIFLSILRTFRSNLIFKPLLYVCFLAFIFSSVNIIHKDVFSDKIVTAYYGQTGVMEVAEFLKSKLDPSKDFILANDNIGFLYGDHFYFWDNIEPYPLILKDFLDNRLEGVKALVLSPEQIDLYPELQEHVIRYGMKRNVLGNITFFYAE